MVTMILPSISGRARHVREVLKPELGQTLRIGLIDGPKGAGVVLACDDDRVVMDCCFEDAPPESPSLSLLLAMPRPKVLKRLWAQIAALGVSKIVLINASKVERNYWDTHIIDESFYRPLLLEGLQQAGDTRLPEVEIQRAFRPWVEDVLPTVSVGHRKWLAYEGDAPRLRVEAEAPKAWLAIGPEGGWNNFELELLGQQGFETFSMGPRILRSDTACIAALSAVHQSMEM